MTLQINLKHWKDYGMGLFFDIQTLKIKVAIELSVQFISAFTLFKQGTNLSTKSSGRTIKLKEKIRKQTTLKTSYDLLKKQITSIGHKAMRSKTAYLAVTKWLRTTKFNSVKAKMIKK